VDRSNGYEEIAERFIAARNPEESAEMVREWAESLPAGATVLDMGCGHGEPIGRILTEKGCRIYAMDASARLLEDFRKRFSGAATKQAAVEESDFFGRQFDGIVAWGLLFLLTEETQALALRKAAKALKPCGKLLFTAPREVVRWKDAMTGRESISLGRQEYRRILTDERLIWEEGRTDERDNYYYFAAKAKSKSL
jgi:cyclopropane fatty-acyl-phospholipid synthase-like methyltransferase